MKAAKTAAQRKEAERERNRQAGLFRREFWIHPDDFERVANYVSKLNKSRLK